MTFGEPITRLRGTPKISPYSTEATDIDWTAPDEVEIDGWAVEFVSSTEALAGQIQIDLRLYGPFGADVKPLDRVKVRGLTYAVQGTRADWRNPFTDSEPGSTVECRRVAG